MQIRPGMDVVDTRGSAIGRVTRVDLEQFVVDHVDGSTTSETYTNVRSIVGEQVVLDTGPDLDRAV